MWRWKLANGMLGALLAITPWLAADRDWRRKPEAGQPLFSHLEKCTQNTAGTSSAGTDELPTTLPIPIWPYVLALEVCMFDLTAVCGTIPSCIGRSHSRGTQCQNWGALGDKTLERRGHDRQVPLLRGSCTLRLVLGGGVGRRTQEAGI